MVAVPESVQREMREHASACAPCECVGALLGLGTNVIVALPLINSSSTPERAFELTAREYLRAEQEAARRGLELLGFFHSHVEVPAIPSMSDLEHARAFRYGYMVPIRNGVALAPVAFHSRE